MTSASPRGLSPGLWLLGPLSAIALVFAISGALYWREADQIEKSVLGRESNRVAIFAHFIEQDIREAITDLRQLEDGDGLQDYLTSGRKENLDRAIHRAAFFSQLSPDYDQVRYLDEHGQEIIRVNWNGAIVPTSGLQNKADRPYFQKANGLHPGQFYISQFDLNVENGQIEHPLKPTIRIATPVFDAAGKRRGVYIINYLGGNLISRLEKFTPQYARRLRILNGQGYWIKAAQPDQEWGFMFPDRSGLTVAKTDPALWANLARDKQGQIPHGVSFFTWYRVVPSEILEGTKGVIVADDDFLIVGAEIPAVEWNAYFTTLRETFTVVTLVLLVLSILSLSFLRSRRIAQIERDRFFTLTRDMLCIAGFDGYFKRVNPAWEKTLGFTKEEMLSKPFVEFLHPDDVEKTKAIFADQKRGREIFNFENRYLCKDGSYRWLMWSARPLSDEKLVYGSARDMTERKGIEQQVLQLNQELKQRAGQLEVANHELEAFSYSVSHDLRAPLRHIHGFVELLQQSQAMLVEESNRRYMEVIARAAQEMGRLIDDLLAFSRTGRAEMHFLAVDPRPLLDQVIKDIESECKGRNILWDIKPMPQVSGDAALLRMVWTNLVSNALKYSRTRDPSKIEIGCRNDPADKSRDEAVFYVRDNGVGFDMQYASKLFGVFQRLHRAEDFEGTGIGLANVQRIIHRHGGRVWAESQIDAGATFYFSLPLAHFK